MPKILRLTRERYDGSKTTIIYKKNCLGIFKPFIVYRMERVECRTIGIGDHRLNPEKFPIGTISTDKYYGESLGYIFVQKRII